MQTSKLFQQNLENQPYLLTSIYQLRADRKKKKMSKVKYCIRRTSGGSDQLWTAQEKQRREVMCRAEQVC